MSLRDFSSLRLLGKGSYGRVYRATRRSDKQEYAIKEMSIAHMSEREREEALSEVRLLASIVHHNVVRFYEAFVEHHQLYIVQEYCRAGDLGRLCEDKLAELKQRRKMPPPSRQYARRHRMRRHGLRSSSSSFASASPESTLAAEPGPGGFTEEKVWSVLVQVCVALKVLHGQGIVHRDIKPQNVFITHKNRIKLGDLGCSKLLKGQQCNTQCGTPYYMSPELWKNKPYGKASDIWAVGCLLYQMAMGSPPFNANDINALAKKVVRGRTPRLTSRHYSPDLIALCKRMLAKKPRDRPTVDDILQLDSVRARMHLVHDPCIDEGFQFDLVNTIKLPRRGFSGLSDKLPPACYHKNKRIESPAKLTTPAAPRVLSSIQNSNDAPASDPTATVLEDIFHSEASSNAQANLKKQARPLFPKVGRARRRSQERKPAAGSQDKENSRLPKLKERKTRAVVARKRSKQRAARRPAAGQPRRRGVGARRFPKVAHHRPSRVW